jgi:hypothetical protein
MRMVAGGSDRRGRANKQKVSRVCKNSQDVLKSFLEFEQREKVWKGCVWNEQVIKHGGSSGWLGAEEPTGQKW